MLVTGVLVFVGVVAAAMIDGCDPANWMILVVVVVVEDENVIVIVVAHCCITLAVFQDYKITVGLF